MLKYYIYRLNKRVNFILLKLFLMWIPEIVKIAYMSHIVFLLDKESLNQR